MEVARGPSSRTRVRVPLPRRLPGLSAVDEDLFRRWWGGVGHNVLELHISVPLGPVPLANLPPDPGGLELGWCHLCAYKLDAAVLTRRGWHLVECKPLAGHKALGQVLSYSQWWSEVRGLGRAAELLVVTDVLASGFDGVYRKHGVHVASVGSAINA